MKILELLANYGFFTSPLAREGQKVFTIDQVLYPNLDLAQNFNYLDKNQINFEHLTILLIFINTCFYNSKTLFS